MKKLSVVLLVLSLLAACSKQSEHQKRSLTEAEKLVQKSLAYHDPNRLFDKTTIKCSIRSTNPQDSVERVRGVRFNTMANVFEMRQKTNGIDEVFQVPNDPSFADSANIARSEMYQDYFRFMLGGAMVLADESAQIHDSLTDTLINGVKAKQIKVSYEPKGENPDWYFAFNPETGEMIQSRFVYNQGKENQRGEYINYGPYVDYKGMKITSKLEWFDLNGDSVAVEKISYID